MPNKTEDDKLFDVIFFGPLFSAPSSKKPLLNKTATKNVTSLSLTFDDGFQVNWRFIRKLRISEIRSKSFEKLVFQSVIMKQKCSPQKL